MRKIIISPYVFAGIDTNKLKSNVRRKLGIEPDTCTKEIVIECVTRVTGIKFDEVKAKIRERNIVTARHLYCHFMKRRLDYTLKEIAKTINRDHSTIINSIHQHDNLYETCEEYRKLANRVKTFINWRD